LGGLLGVVLWGVLGHADSQSSEYAALASLGRSFAEPVLSEAKGSG
jgi:hypothetical protein